MRNTARALLPLAVFFFLSACRSVPSASSEPALSPQDVAILTASPNIIVGRVLSIDAVHGFALIDISPSSPPSAIAPDRELITRGGDLGVTAHLRATRQFRSRTLGTVIISGTPNLGDEVIFPTSP